MTTFFFYSNLVDVTMIDKITSKFEINDGYILVKKYDRVQNILEISKNINDNNVVLHGKIVKFSVNLNYIIDKINKIHEIKMNKQNYKLDAIWANKINGGVYKSYIIY